MFYITVLDKKKSVINELIYSRASRFSFNNIPEQMLFYENIPVNNDSININFQLYNILQIIIHLIYVWLFYPKKKYKK